ncbi:MAG: 3TM-type holin [Tepidiformaceae bacterium]
MAAWFSWLGSAAGSAAGETVARTLGSVGTVAKDIRAAITGLSPEDKGKIEVALAQLEVQTQAGQQALNEMNAGSHSFFIAGWRPAVGWTCVFALNWHYILRDTLAWVLSSPMPRLDVTDLLALLAALLGLGAYRTFEKTR